MLYRIMNVVIYSVGFIDLNLCNVVFNILLKYSFIEFMSDVCKCDCLIANVFSFWIFSVDVYIVVNGNKYVKNVYVSIVLYSLF